MEIKSKLSAWNAIDAIRAVPRNRGLRRSPEFSNPVCMITTVSWAYVPLATAQSLIGVGDVANVIEVKVNDIYERKRWSENYRTDWR